MKTYPKRKGYFSGYSGVTPIENLNIIKAENLKGRYGVH